MPDARSSPRTALACLALSLLTLDTSGAGDLFSGDAYDAALIAICGDGSEQYVVNTGSGPGPCLGEIFDGVPHTCGTNVFTGSPVQVVETQSVNGTTDLSVILQSGDDTDLLPSGLFCAPGFSIGVLRLVLGKEGSGGPGLEGDQLDPGLANPPNEILSGDGVVWGTAGQELLRVPTGDQGQVVFELGKIFDVFGANTVPIAGVGLEYTLDGVPPALAPPSPTAGDAYQTADFGLISEDAAEPTRPVEQAPGNLAPGVIDPVVVTTGERVTIDDIDRSLGGPSSLAFPRYYAGFQGDAAERAGVHGRLDGPLGAHWSHGYHMLLRRESVTRVSVLFRKGAVLVFEKTGASWVLQPGGYRGIPYQMVESGSKLELMDPSVRRIYRFELVGTPDAGIAPVDQIRDRDGNALTLVYNPDGTLASVDDGLGRSLTFTHVDSGGVQRIAQVTDHTGRSVSYGYTGASLTSVTDARGGVTTYAYDADSRMTSVTRPQGNQVMESTHDASGRVLTHTDGEGAVHSLTYAPGSTTITDPLGHARTYAFDPELRVTGFTDEAGETIAYTHDADHRRLTTTDRLGDVQSLSYHAPSGYVASRTDAEGNTWSYTYASQPQDGFTFWVLERIDYPDGSSAALAHDARGNVTSLTDGEGNATTWTHNARGQPLTRTNAAGGVTTWTYNPDATIATHTDPSGNVTAHGYDAQKRLVSIQRPGLTAATFSWDPNDNLLSATDENGHATTWTYDSNDNPTTLTDPEGHLATLVYDGNDDPVEITDPRGEMTALARDGLRRISGVTDARANSTAVVYDSRRRLTQIIDGLSETWTISHDLEGVPTSFSDPLGQAWLVQSDALGRFTRVEDPLGNATALAYDALGRLLEATDPLGQTEALERDGNGQVTAAHLDLPGHTALYTRNALLQIDAITDLRGEVWQRPRDSQGRPASRTDPLGNVESYAHDARNRVEQITLPGGLGTVDLTHDEADRLVRIDYSDGTSFVQTYDDDGLLLTTTGVSFMRDERGQITDSNGLGMTYDASGNLATVSYAPGKTVTYSYDARDQLASVTDWAAGVTTFTRDDDGKVLAIDHTNGTRTQYAYDDADRLIGITETANGGATPLASIALTLDADGQITQALRDLPLQPATPPTPVVLAYDAASQPLGTSHDAMGRLLDDGRSFTWNLADQLVSYTEGGSTVDFTRDAFGNVLTRTRAGSTRGSLWNYALELPSIATETQDGTPLRHHVYTPGGRLLYSLEAADDTRRVYHHDEMGSTVLVTDGTGSATAAYAYAPWGELLAESGGLDNAFTWHGQLGVQREGSLYSMRARYYDARAARFASRDPLQQLDARSTNPYQALFANPLGFVDPRGTDPEDRHRIWRPPTPLPFYPDSLVSCPNDGFFSNPTSCCERFLRRLHESQLDRQEEQYDRERELHHERRQEKERKALKRDADLREEDQALRQDRRRRHPSETPESEIIGYATLLALDRFFPLRICDEEPADHDEERRTRDDLFETDPYLFLQRAIRLSFPDSVRDSNRDPDLGRRKLSAEIDEEIL